VCVLNLSPNPSHLEGFGTPASLSGAWTRHRCRAEGFATRPATELREANRIEIWSESHRSHYESEAGDYAICHEVNIVKIVFAPKLGLPISSVGNVVSKFESTPKATDQCR
jgi:hypothetical protein